MPMGPSWDERSGNVFSNHIYALIHNRMHRAPKILWAIGYIWFEKAY